MRNQNMNQYIMSILCLYKKSKSVNYIFKYITYLITNNIYYLYTLYKHNNNKY